MSDDQSPVDAGGTRSSSSGAPIRRFPRAVYGVGNDPDPRFSMANERTFLAWIRTSLALLAGGVALESLALGLQPGLRLAASLVLIITGILTAIQSWVGWTRTERSLRAGEPLPSPALALPAGVAVVVAGILVLLGLVF